ncbi:MAG: CapA family protein [Gaiellaceae bacterium]
MRPIALVVRAGAVVIAAAFLFSLVVDGAPTPIDAQARTAAAKPGEKAKARTTQTAQKPKRSAAASSVITIAAVGDIVMGSTPNLPRDGGRTFFDGVAADLAGDVVLGNLEGTLSTGGSSKCGSGSTNCFAFQTPPSYARWLKGAGFTVMNLANNHAFDFGHSGQAQTLAALRAQDLATTGRPGEIALQQVGDVTVAVVGFAPYPWAQQLTDIPAARRLVRKAAAAADVVIVTMHAGAEGTAHTHTRRGTEMYLGENRGNVVAFSHAVVDAGADLVVGHGPHVLRGMEWHRGRLIAYSLGNFAGYRVFSLGGALSTSGILRVTLRGDGTYETGLLVPTRLVGAGTPALDPAEAAHGAVRQLSRADFGARGARIAANGTIHRGT